MTDDQNWTRITAALFRKTEVPPSEIFVSRVMAHLPNNNETSHWGWMIPSFGFCFAVFVFVLSLTSVRSDVSAETLLLSDTTSPDSQLLFSDSAPGSETALGLTMEELR
jgi:hypothetical protein